MVGIPTWPTGDDAPVAEGVATGVCFGFEPRSDIPLRYLRSGSGVALDVRRSSGPEPSALGPLVKEWRPPANPLLARLYRDDAGFQLWVEDGGWFGIDTERP